MLGKLSLVLILLQLHFFVTVTPYKNRKKEFVDQHQKDENGQKVEELQFGQHPEKYMGQKREGINFGQHPEEYKGQQAEELKFGQHPQDHTGQQVEEISFGQHPEEYKGQEAEELKFGQHPEEHKGQQVEEISFGQHPEEYKGQEAEELKFGQHPEEHKGQQVEEISFGQHPEDHKGQEAEEVDFGQHPEGHKGQEAEELKFGQHPEDHSGQQVEEISFGQHPEEYKGQEAEELKFGQHPEDHKGQETEELKFGQHPEEHTGQQAEKVDFGQHPEDHRGQQVEEISFGQHPEDHKGQETEELKFSQHPEEHTGQHAEEVDFGQHPEDHKGQEAEELKFGQHPEEHKGQHAEEVDFGQHPDEHKGQHVEEVDFGQHPEEYKGQEAEELKFGQHPEEHKGQHVEEVDFGQHPDEHKGQHVEEVDFGQHPEDHHKGQHAEEVDFGQHPDEHKGQHAEEVDFGQHPDEHKGQHVEEVDFGQHPEDHKGQEAEELKFGQHPEEHKGQHVEEVDFGQHPEEHKGQHAEEVDFGQHPEDHKGQEAEELKFGQHPEEHKGQHAEEVDFGQHPDEHKGQHVEEVDFGQHPEDHKGQEAEELKFGQHPEEQKGQHVEEVDFGQHPEDHKGQEAEELKFGQHPEDHIGQQAEEVDFGQHPEDHKGQEAEELKFGQHPEDHIGQQAEEVDFGQHYEEHNGQQAEVHFGQHPQEHKGQNVEEQHPKENSGQAVDEIDYGQHPADSKGREIDNNSGLNNKKSIFDFWYSAQDSDGHTERYEEDTSFGGVDGNWFHNLFYGSDGDDQVVHKAEGTEYSVYDGHETGENSSEVHEVTTKGYTNGHSFVSLPFDILSLFGHKGCHEKLEPPMNSVLRCKSDRQCTATCHEGFLFSNGLSELTFHCERNTWITYEPNFSNSRPHCEPVCLPPCQNGGSCVQPGQCQCLKGFQGPQCQFHDEPCTSHPPVSLNSQVRCTASTCDIECSPGYYFPDGSSSTTLHCHEGEWTLSRTDWTSLPDCKPSCHPPCLNGGICLSLDKCQCSESHKGPQCQYETAACSGHKMNFNGFYSCHGDNDKVSCTLQCPEEHPSDVPISSEYTCYYSTGKFLPEPIPKCIYGKDVEVVKFSNSSNSVHGLPGGFESSNSGDTPVSHRNPALGTCSSWADSHYKTFDGQIFSFDIDCPYTLVEDTVGNAFKIIIGRLNCEDAVCPRQLTIFYNDRKYLLHYKGGVPVFSVDNHVKAIPLQLDGLVVEQSREGVIVSLASVDVDLVWSNLDHLSITVLANMWNRTGGLCGNFNGDAADDLAGSTSEPDLQSFVDTWMTNDFDRPRGCNPSVVRQESCHSDTSYCDEVFADSRFQECLKVDEFKEYKRACQRDVCKCGQMCACSTLKEFVENCKTYLVSRGFLDKTFDWRETFNCRMDCPRGKMYSDCGPAVESTCGFFESPALSSGYSKCVEGCFCPEGKVLFNETCVRKEDCPCQWKNRFYNSGEKIQKDCNTCTCQNGEWICTTVKCGARCSVTGSVHYVTFDGKRYDFRSECSHILVRSEEYFVEYNYYDCDSPLGCLKSIKVEYENNQIELRKDREVLMNHLTVSSLPVQVAGINVRRVSSVYTVVTLPDGVEVWWDGTENVYVDLPINYDEPTAGLCGTFNNNQKDDFLTPEGDVEQSPTAFATKWKTAWSCDKEVLPFNERSCDYEHIEMKEMAEMHCGHLRELFKDCHESVDVEPFYKNCLNDVCSCKKETKFCFCPIFADYGNECSRQGIHIPWRMDMKECGLDCPPGQTYQPCGDTCTRSCQDITALNGTCQNKCVEGCNCPEGLTLDPAGRCIPVKECPCFHENTTYKPDEEVMLESKDGPQLCTCTNARLSCRHATRLEIDRNYENGDEKCSDKNEVYTNCEPAEPRTCQNMHEAVDHGNRICFPGCVCKSGFVWDSIGKKCVNASECPCHHGGKTYEKGETMQDDCNTCSCENGVWSCTTRECGSVCSAWGDSHFKTFDGKIFDFQGSCEFVLATGSLTDLDSFFISLDIVPCGTTGISCPKALTVSVGSPGREEQVVFRKSNPDLHQPGLERIHVRESGIFVFIEVLDLGLTVKWDKNSRVYVKADSRWKNRVKGLCGNFNDNELDDFKTPTSGEATEISPVVFADSWRVQTYCPPTSGMIDACDVRPHREAWAVEKCSILKSSTFEACHSEVLPEPYFERCVVDTCGCDEGGDCECLCSAIAAYAEECTLRGVPIKWRDNSLCPMQCHADEEYSSCVPACPPKSCENRYQQTILRKACSKETCVEGCKKPECPDGHVLAGNSSNVCVPLSSCTTVCLTVNGVTYLEGDLMESDDCHSCFCSHHKRVCTGKPCPKVTTPLVIRATSPTTEVVRQTTVQPGPTPMTGCLPGEVWDECLITCDRLCNHLVADAQVNHQCSEKNNCLSGCRPEDFECPPGTFLRHDYKCVPKRDCPCLSKTGSLVKPGEVVEISECEKCQCVNNEYECHFVCTGSPLVTSTHPPLRNYTQKVNVVTAEVQFAEAGNVTLVYHRTTEPPMVAAHCPPEKYASLLNFFTKFSTNSLHPEEESSATDLSKNENNMEDGWTAATENGDQFLQVDLGRVEPVHGVAVSGKSGRYVTSYHLQYSTNGRKFYDVLNENGAKEVFAGPFDGHHSAKRVLAKPVEARYVRFYPLSWHKGIGMRVDVLGCQAFDPSPPPHTTALPPLPCEKALALGHNLYPRMHITVSSFKPNAGPDHLGLHSDHGWQPMTNSKREWVQIDFGNLANITGVVTRGVPETNDLTSSTPVHESWLERYKISYSHDGETWNPVLDDFGDEMIFMGNTDGETLHTNRFKRPIRARALRLSPVKWHEGIVLKMDLTGCYDDSPSDEMGHTTEASEPECRVCPGVPHDSTDCQCTKDQLWTGEKCVEEWACPCFYGNNSYASGTTYTTENCDVCVCLLYGSTQCERKQCPECPKSQQRVLTPQCGCKCQECPDDMRLCPTSNICIKKEAWCDGVHDCPDDEADCQPPHTTPKVDTGRNSCEAFCPPGYSVVYRNKFTGPAEVDTSHRQNVVKSTKSVKTYRSSKKTKKTGKPIKLSECPPYDCVPTKEKEEDEDEDYCPAPECPADYLVVPKESLKAVKGACPLYTCKPTRLPRFDNCTVSPQSVKTFDGVDYKYDICDHVLTRDDHGLWNVTMVKDCSVLTRCHPIILIHHGTHVIELRPHNGTVKIDSFTYVEDQVPSLNLGLEDFNINPVGSSIVFTSSMYGFEVRYDANGHARITVLGKLKGHLNGLCGLYNGHPEDDKTLPGGELSKTTVEFGDSWLNQGAKECLEPVCPPEKHSAAVKICSALKDEPFNKCPETSDVGHCVETVCECLTSDRTEDECRCSKLSEVASGCSNPDLLGWRLEHDCPSFCPPHLVHYDCYPYACEPGCGTEDECAEPATECFSGCFCPDGMVKKDNQCIKVAECRDCMCSGMGDSTYITFDGALTFNGNCTYVATRSKHITGSPQFEVLITNNICEGSDFATCTKAIEIRLGENFLKLISTPETPEKLKIVVDGVAERNPLILRQVGNWAKVDHSPDTSSVTVNLPKQHLEVRYFYKRFAFTITLPSHLYSDRVDGLCGTCGDNVELENIADPDVWQTEPGKRCLIEPPTACAPTPEHEKMCQMMTDVERFGQCLAFVDPVPFIDRCLETLCLNGHICNSLEAFAQACRDMGLCVNWRSHDFCPYTCPSDLEYQSCKEGCFKTCENLDEMSGTCHNPPVEGCFCPNNEILINGTCKPEKYCKYCDDEGGHYEGDTWQVDKCTNCTCNNRVITCNNVKCSIPDVTCDEDEVLVAEESDSECCPNHKCVCKPLDKCPKVEMPRSEDLAVGLVAVMNEAGCCPKVEVICQRESCPKPKPCKPHYELKVINGTDCCPEHYCVKPRHLCVYEYDEQVNYGLIEGTNAGETLKKVGDRWSDGPCKTCFCVEKDEDAETMCTMTECPDLEEHRDFNDYELMEIINPDKCCPEVVRKKCKHGGRIYEVGDTWLPDEKKPCETMKCNILGDGLVQKEMRLQVCNRECEQLGWEYVHEEGSCCGRCEQVGCVADDHVYKDGEVWVSNDECANNTCINKNGLFTISTVIESCPVIDDCPKEDVYLDKCCLKCKIRSESRTNCFPTVVSPESTVGLLKEKKWRHGMCQNYLPLQNFTQCIGHCDSHTEFDPDTFGHKSVCKCCQPEEFTLMSVELVCADGHKLQKSITVPSKCSCFPCGG